LGEERPQAEAGECSVVNIALVLSPAVAATMFCRAASSKRQLTQFASALLAMYRTLSIDEGL
jgi:hypothetical protein